VFDKGWMEDGEAGSSTQEHAHSADDQRGHGAHHEALQGPELMPDAEGIAKALA